MARLQIGNGVPEWWVDPRSPTEAALVDHIWELEARLAQCEAALRLAEPVLDEFVVAFLDGYEGAGVDAASEALAATRAALSAKEGEA